jgi:AcrR family transcriptional regulator
MNVHSPRSAEQEEVGLIVGLTAEIETPAPDPRMGAILDQVRGVFAAKGFEKASMQDLARAASMSAGNFYRYFPSKDAIIEALVERDLAVLQAEFEALMRTTDPLSALRAALDDRIEDNDCDDGAIWSEIIAAANRRADVGDMVGRVEATLIGYLVTVFGRIAGIGAAAARQRFQPHATLIFMLIQGIKMRRKKDASAEFAQLRALARRTIDGLLADISSAAAPAAARSESN